MKKEKQNIRPKKSMTVEEYCEKVRSGEIKPFVITSKIAAKIEKEFMASEEAFNPLVERLREARRFSAQDLGFRVNV